MGEEIVTRCGMRCDLCVAYIRHPDHQNLEARKRASGVWEKYFGFRIEPGDIVCGGCFDDECLLDKDCPVRPCVIRHGYETCAQCGEFEECQTLDKRLVDEDHTAEKAGGTIPESDRKYIEAFINHRRLQEMRSQAADNA